MLGQGLIPILKLNSMTSFKDSIRLILLKPCNYGAQAPIDPNQPHVLSGKVIRYIV